MRDLKQRLFDLLRSSGNNSSHNNGNNSSNSSHGNSHHTQHGSHVPAQKPKKLHEYTAADCNAAFLRKYHDLSISRDRELHRERDRERERAAPGAGAALGASQVPNVIYFNENLSMASKYSVRPFLLTRYPSCPLNSFGPSQSGRRNEGSAGSSLGEDDEEEEEEAEETEYFCSDEDHSSHTQMLKLRHHHDHDMDMPADREDQDQDLQDDDPAESQLDSFCTLCTSTFSYNKCCRFCENSLCGSKCNSERGSHASRMSRVSQNMNVAANGFPADPELDPHHYQQQHRFGGSMRMLPNHYQPAVIR